jgi:hypothetical protein
VFVREDWSTEALPSRLPRHRVSTIKRGMDEKLWAWCTSWWLSLKDVHPRNTSLSNGTNALDVPQERNSRDES